MVRPKSKQRIKFLIFLIFIFISFQFLFSCVNIHLNYSKLPTETQKQENEFVSGSGVVFLQEISNRNHVFNVLEKYKKIVLECGNVVNPSTANHVNNHPNTLKKSGHPNTVPSTATANPSTANPSTATVNPSTPSCPAIPKLLFTYWSHPDNIPLLVKLSIRSWAYFNPDHDILLVTAENIQLVLETLGTIHVFLQPLIARSCCSSKLFRRYTSIPSRLAPFRYIDFNLIY